MSSMEEIDATVKKIKDLHIQGAQDIARKSLKVLRRFARENGFGSDFEEAVNKLEHSRPTGVSAHNCLEHLKNNRSVKTIDELLRYMNKSDEWIGDIGSDLIDDNTEIMTHCHSETAMGIFKKAKENGKNFKVFVTETRPKYQGILTAKELAKYDIPIYYIIDSAAGIFMYSCEMVLIGGDAVKSDGIINKIGTYMIALAANEADVPVYVAASKDKFDYENVSVIEERPAKEIISPAEIRGGRIDNPAFDITPWHLIDGVITESGILEEDEVIEELTNEFDIED
ncbi:MAG: translation initiation factor eIF-2B [Candidatus Aenigmatarchaeota archaeon]